jgi:hypothetical protein
MSGGSMCECSGFHGTTKRQAKQAYREKHWRVVQYKCNHSAFSGYHYTPSDYSCITCTVCGHFWRTKAAYVGTLKRVTNKEMGIKGDED